MDKLFKDKRAELNKMDYSGAEKRVMSKLFTDKEDFEYLYRARYWHYIKKDYHFKMAARMANADVEDARKAYTDSLMDVDNGLTGEQSTSWKKN